MAGLFAMLLWCLWNNRNNRLWNDASEPGRSIGLKAKHLWEEWAAVQQWQQRRHSTEQQQHITNWQPPNFGWLKCNVDAGFHRDLNKTSSGWCLRDHQGQFVLAGSRWMEGQCSILEGEAIAVLEALKVLTQYGFDHVMVETDSKSVVEAIHHIRGGSSEFSNIICHINNIMLCNPNFTVKFIKRQANMAAHSIARAAISWPRRCILETLPSCISPILNNEMA